MCVAGGAVLLPTGTGCSSRAGIQRSCVTKVRLRRERATEQEANPDLLLSGADSHWCPSSLHVVLTLFTVWADANLRMSQDEK